MISLALQRLPVGVARDAGPQAQPSSDSQAQLFRHEDIPVTAGLVVDHSTSPGTVVLDSSANAILTQVICYPVYFVGFAPGRFIVRAERVT